MPHTLLHKPIRTTPLAACLALALALGESAAWGDTPPGFAIARHGFGGGSRYTGFAARADAEARSAKRSVASAAAPRPQVPILPVTSCDDDGSPGTLRSVVASALSGDIVDLGALTCSTISLANGAIGIPIESLQIVGPGSALLTLDANQSYKRIFQHSGHGTLTVSGLRLTHGWADIGWPAYGGCIYSQGSVDLTDVAVVACKAVSVAGVAKGGGIWTGGSLTLHRSVVSGNQANPGTDAYGGGAFAAGGLYLYSSTVSDNFATNAYGGGFGGGLFTLGNANIVASTISNNHAVNVGGVSIAGYAAGAVIVNSTVSGNLASQFIAGVYSNSPLYVYNSTIAFNTAAQTSTTFVTAGGLQVYATSADLQSSIIANNSAGATAFDVGMSGGGSVTGANNLIRIASNLMPADTIIEDPQLLPLQDNGGETATLALAATSPAIDRGNIVGADDYDQRGLGYVRVFGAAADIGAFEVQDIEDDLIFRNGFDGGMQSAPELE